MKKVPPDIEDILKGYHTDRIIYENDLFLVVRNPNHYDDDLYHYTAWCKEDLRSLLDIERKHIPSIHTIIHWLETYKNIYETKQFIHFPPQFWRLHIHFMSPEHFQEINIRSSHHTHDLSDVIQNIRHNEEYYRQNVIIIPRS